MITFQQEMLHEVVGEVDELLRLHYEELCGRKDVIKLAPLWGKYEAMERAGMLAVYTARDDGALVGYSAFVVMPHLHYGNNTVAVNDVLFLRESHRQGTAGIRFIRHCEREVTALGAQKITWGAKPGTNLEPILRRLGYKTEDIILSKML